MGGNGKFTLQKEILNSESSKSLNINLTPEIDYFFYDEFVDGSRIH